MKARALHILFLAGVAVLVQLVLISMGKGFYLTQVTMALYYAVVVLGLCLLMGYAGQASLRVKLSSTVGAWWGCRPGKT